MIGVIPSGDTFWSGLSSVFDFVSVLFEFRGSSSFFWIGDFSFFWIGDFSFSFSGVFSLTFSGVFSFGVSGCFLGLARLNLLRKALPNALCLASWFLGDFSFYPPSFAQRLAAANLLGVTGCSGAGDLSPSLFSSFFSSGFFSFSLSSSICDFDFLDIFDLLESRDTSFTFLFEFYELSSLSLGGANP